MEIGGVKRGLKAVLLMGALPSLHIGSLEHSQWGEWWHFMIAFISTWAMLIGAYFYGRRDERGDE
ncbi:hypothetical protein C4587_00765 [Candidatus Parcubacteria bacterium]|nr:MAG: hypothetical protein C4587_00765 [Candidatus Parcubacteria bacterium]